jgi:HAD superfamily hydrolase (TIGR01490 family)
MVLPPLYPGELLLALAIFDLDETLIAADSDQAWGEFVAAKGLVDAEHHRSQNEAFYEDYKRGTLDINAYMRFSCTVLAMYDMDKLQGLRREFFDERIRPLLLPKASELIERHRARGDSLVVITATIEFVTEPIVEHLGIEHLIASIPEIKAGRYTGEVVGTPSFREGKVTRIREWLDETGEDFSGSTFYSDSRNDLPLLELVDFPVAVDPDPVLRDIAQARQWPVISLRG